MAIGWVTGFTPPGGPASGDLAGTYPAPSVVALRSRTLSSAVPRTKQGLVLVGTEWTPTDVNQLVVPQARRLATVLTSSPPSAPVTYLTLSADGLGTPIALAVGRYRFDITTAFSTSSSNTQIWYDVRVNGAPSQVGATVEPIGVAGGVVYRTSFDTFDVLAPVALTFAAVFAKNAGTGSVSVLFSVMTLTQVSTLP